MYIRYGDMDAFNTQEQELAHNHSLKKIKRVVNATHQQLMDFYCIKYL